MGTGYTPSNVQVGFQSTTLFNSELAAIASDLADKVDRTGRVPNAMAADFDVGTNQLLNVETGVLGTDGVNLAQVSTIATAIATSINSGGAGQGQTTGDPITINYGQAVGSQGTMTRTVFDLNALFGVTILVGMSIFLNGVAQYPSGFTVLDTTVTFSESLNNDTDILFVFGDLTPIPVFSSATATLNDAVATATAGQTVFTAPTYVIAKKQLLVHIDGVFQSITLGDYTETTTTSITFDEAMAGGEKIVIINISGV